MLALWCLIAAAPLSFLEQPLPGVRVGPVTPFTGKPITNFIHADLNSDGLPDLVLPGGVLFQKDGGYPKGHRVPLPDLGGAIEADVFGDALYYRTPNHLAVYRFTDGIWRTHIEQPLSWPGAATAPPKSGTGLAFRRFVYDVDGDNIPELVDLDGAGIHLYRLREGRYETAGVLDVLPAMTLSPSTTHDIWPADVRRIVLPEQQLSCRLLVQPHELTLITQRGITGGQAFYQRDTFALQVDESGGIVATPGSTSNTNGLPTHVRPCHLNHDAQLDFAGGRWLLSETTPIPMPIYELSVSLDGGGTFHVERAACFPQFRPHCNFVDFDSDGSMDMVLESTQLYDSGVRETINRYLTQRSLSHRIRIHRQEDGAFQHEPAIVHTLNITLDAPPVAGGAMISRYQSGRFVNLTGDFDGDGYRDLAVRTSLTDVAIHLADGWNGYSRTPTENITIPALAEFAVADLNGDGRSDILVTWEEELDNTTVSHAMAYFTRELSR